MTVPLTGDSADVEQMKRVEQAVLTTLLQFRENTEAAILICALVRLTQGLLKQYVGNMRLVLRDYCMDFLKEKRLPDGDPASKLLLFH